MYSHRRRMQNTNAKIVKYMDYTDQSLFWVLLLHMWRKKSCTKPFGGSRGSCVAFDKLPHGMKCLAGQSKASNISNEFIVGKANLQKAMINNIQR